MMKIFIFLILFFKMSTAKAPEPINQWIIWNVGQGQWITEITNETCTHFDFGGEIFALKKIKPLLNQNCRYKINQLYLSHADWDHYSFYNFIVQNNIQTCWKSKPLEPLKKINLAIPFCNTVPSALSLVNPVTILFYDPLQKKRNESSTVLEVNNFLIPGDSPIPQEKKWLKNISDKNKIHFLILGHHGSRTSTSEALLKKIPDLKMAIATSRYKKYRHPHKDVIDRLHNHHLNVIKTEDWGSILIQ